MAYGNCYYNYGYRKKNVTIVGCKIYSLLKITVPSNSSKKLSQNVSDVIVYRIHNGPRWKLKQNTRKLNTAKAFLVNTDEFTEISAN